MAEKTSVEVREAKARAAYDASTHPTTDSEQIEKKRRAAVSDAPKRDDRMIAALRREREGLVQAGKDDRVEQVDEQLKLHGYTEAGKSSDKGADKGDDASKDEKSQQARKQPPQGRTTRPQQTTD